MYIEGAITWFSLNFLATKTNLLSLRGASPVVVPAEIVATDGYLTDSEAEQKEA